MKIKYLPIILAAPAAFVSCENPADKTTDAKVTDAVETSSAPVEGGTKYVFTPASEVNFVGSKVTRSHHGGFKKFSGYFTVKDGVVSTSGNRVTIEMSSVFADDEKLTNHLKGKDFFDVERFPVAEFELTGLKKDSETAYTVSGNFNLHGKTKNISFPATVSTNAASLMIHSTFDINRKDFGVVYAGMADDLIRDEVVIELKLEAKPEA